MFVISYENCKEVAGACPVSIGGYIVDAPGVDCQYAELMAEMYNYDLATSGLVNYQAGAGGYSQNNHYADAVVKGMLGNQYWEFLDAMNAVIPRNINAYYTSPAS